MLPSNHGSIAGPPSKDDQHYATQYAEDLVGRWDELIDWDKRAAGEGQFFIQMLLGKGACRIFDASTGSGFHAVQLRQAGFQVVANDGSPNMVKKAKANLAIRGLDIPVTCRDWRDLCPGQQGRFDAVLCLGNSLCHMFTRAQRIEVLKRFRSLLKPGGQLLIDQRNFLAILAGHFSPSGRYHYCGTTAQVALGELSEAMCEFVYTFDDGACHRLRVAPVLPEQLRSEMRAAGFVEGKSYGDFKRVWDPFRADFIVHQGIA